MTRYFSEPVLTDHGDRVELTWMHHGTRRMTVISDELLETAVAEINRHRKARAIPHTDLRDQLHATIRQALEEGWTAKVAADRCIHTLVLHDLLPETAAP